MDHFFQTYLKRFRENGSQLPGAYDVRETRGIPGAINVNGAEHMDMILKKMKDVEYDKYHKPNPSGKLEVSTNMFIDSVQGTVSETIDSTFLKRSAGSKLYLGAKFLKFCFEMF